MSKDLVEQTRNAFDFVQKLFFEISYLIKDIEGLLQQEDEKFQILRPSGYGVTTKSSTGLEPINVEQWLNKNFTVFYCPESMTELKGGQTITEFNSQLKILFVHIRIINKLIEQPQIVYGYINNIQCKKNDWRKFENITWVFASNGAKILKNINDVSYDDSYCSFKGAAGSCNLYDISNSEDVINKIINPALKLYRNNV